MIFKNSYEDQGERNARSLIKMVGKDALRKVRRRNCRTPDIATSHGRSGAARMISRIRALDEALDAARAAGWDI